MVNTRSDSTEKPMFKKAFEDNRCLIIADGFYEWKDKLTCSIITTDANSIVKRFIIECL